MLMSRAVQQLMWAELRFQTHGLVLSDMTIETMITHFRTIS